MLRALLPLLAAVAVALAGCGYDPPVKADTASAKYRADLKTCRGTAGTAANLAVARRFPTWVAYPFTYPPAYRRDLRGCLASKGYTLGG